MTDRDAFLRAIRRDPASDVARLVFADWLEEQGDPSPVDLAAAAYIRLSCGVPAVGPGSRRANRTRWDWLRANWRRLVPTLTAEWDRFPAEEPLRKALEEAVKSEDPLRIGEAERAWAANPTRTWERWKAWPNSGHVHVGVPLTLGSKTYVSSVKLWFARGFLAQAEWKAPRLGEKLAALIAADQPLAELGGPGAPQGGGATGGQGTVALTVPEEGEQGGMFAGL